MLLRASGHDSDERKRGEEVAHRIEADVIAAGWPVGGVLGSEGELLERYGVSRGVLREALRVLEYLGVARMRRGPGGVVVTRPDPSAVTNAVVVYLTFARARLEEVLALRSAIEESAARLAAERRTWDDIALLESTIAAEREHGVDEVALHRTIAGITRNPAFELFVEILGRISSLYFWPSDLSAIRRRSAIREATAAHQRLVDAIIAGDADAAARRVVRHLDAGRDYLSARQLDRTLGFAEAIAMPDGSDSRLAPVVARRIYTEVVARGWPIGELLGSEAELIVRHGVSRAVLREAMRLLEYNGIVRTRRGPGGGIFVAAPSQAATVGAMAVYLESRTITPQHLLEVRQAVELATLDLTVTTLDDQGAAALEEALEHERRVDDVSEIGHALHERIAELSGNRVLHLFVNALTRLALLHTSTSGAGLGVSSATAATQMRNVHEAIVEAILSGDRDLARKRMERHLVALMPMQH